jgi:hypothetical protein
MYNQTGQPRFTESDTGGLIFLREREAGGEGNSTESRGLPSFVSSEPPRSEGEALLRRIFSRGERM